MCLLSYSQDFFLLISTFFINDSATSNIYTLSLHDALPISPASPGLPGSCGRRLRSRTAPSRRRGTCAPPRGRSEEHTSELQSRRDLVCRLLLEKKNPYERKMVKNPLERLRSH